MVLFRYKFGCAILLLCYKPLCGAATNFATNFELGLQIHNCVMSHLDNDAYFKHMHKTTATNEWNMAHDTTSIQPHKFILNKFGLKKYHHQLNVDFSALNKLYAYKHCPLFEKKYFMFFFFLGVRVKNSTKQWKCDIMKMNWNMCGTVHRFIIAIEKWFMYSTLQL